MTDTQHHSPLRTAAALSLAALLLTGCASGPEAPVTKPEAPPQESEIETLLREAEQAPPLASAQYTLEAAARLIEAGKADEAEALLNEITPLILDRKSEQRLWLLRARIADLRQQPEAAVEWLDRITAAELLSPEERALRFDLASRGYKALGSDWGELRVLMEQSSLQSDSPQALADEIWRRLQALPVEEIEARLQQRNSYAVQGWLELAALMRRPQQDIRTSDEALKEWLSLWSLHPAATSMPTPLEALAASAGQKIAHIGVWLPQSGPLEKPARAILEGMVAAWMAEGRNGRPRPRLTFYDSNQLSDPDALYEKALGDGAELIIGPLDKSRINLLADRERLPLPTLGLNYVEHSSINPDLYQFGLRAEDEAEQIAELAWQAGYRVALTLTPAADWGDRALAAFRKRWQALGGAVAASERFASSRDVAPSVRTLLAVDRSEERAKEIRSLTSEPLEFEARRRQDADFVFIAARPGEARQIKPTLAFYFASRLPVLATSHVHGGEDNRSRDLDGLRFLEIPWLLDANLPLRADIARKRADAASAFGRLYALGADALQLAPWLARLRALPGSRFAGTTGTLTLDEEGAIRRTLTLAEFARGKVRTLPGQ